MMSCDVMWSGYSTSSNIEIFLRKVTAKTRRSEIERKVKCECSSVTTDRQHATCYCYTCHGPPLLHIIPYHTITSAEHNNCDNSSSTQHSLLSLHCTHSYRTYSIPYVQHTCEGAVKHRYQRLYQIFFQHFPLDQCVFRLTRVRRGKR